ncbi:MAG TPA: response regulator transcription factor [Capsulimonadaceae bacterium]
MQVLVVEDEPKVAGFIVDALTDVGHTVDVEYTGVTAAEAMERRAYDLVILDHLLPGKLGRDLCAEARGRGNMTPVLMVTARDSVNDRVAGLDAGADDYLTKPFAIDELLARVRALLRRQSTGSSVIVTVQDLVMDTTKREVSRRGRVIDLSSREYDLLEFLAQHAGRTVTRSMIAEQVWGVDFDTGTNIVEVYVSYLRAKVDQGCNAKLIKTVRGIGYQLG